MAPIFAAGLLTETKASVALLPRTRRQWVTPARSVDSTMAESRDPTHTEDSPALAAFTAAAPSMPVAADFTAEAAATEAEVVGSSYEVMKP